MKKGIISILGTIGHTQRIPYIENNEIKYCFNEKEEKDKAYYYFGEKFDFIPKHDKYFNMFPLVLQNFKEYKHIPIYTKLSLKIQQSLLDFENIDFDIRENGFFVSEDIREKESEYSYFLSGINEIMEEYDSVIIDMTHGFRHFPILAIINLIIQNIKNPEKIEYIFFAKEIEQFKKYEIIDLKEYLELANLSFMLSTFNQNYTVSSSIRFTNLFYKKIAKELSEFSSHFLSNSFKPLIEGEIIENIIDNLEQLQKEKSVENFKNYIVEIIEHLEDIRQLKYENDWKKLHKLSIIMDDRGYQLNAITLLFEALGFYCLDSICQVDSVKKRADEYKYLIEMKERPLHIYSVYTMVNQSRVITKIRNGFKVSDNRLFIDSEDMKRDIVDYLNSIENLNQFKQFIETLEALRNNLAHGNSGFTLKDVQAIYTKNLHKFKKFIIEDDILKQRSSIDLLSNKWH